MAESTLRERTDADLIRETLELFSGPNHPAFRALERMAAALERVEALREVLESAGYHDDPNYYWSVIQDALKILNAPAGTEEVEG